MPTPNQSETPRTDAEEFVAKEEAYDCSTMVVSVDFARELERELNESKKRILDMEDSLTVAHLSGFHERNSEVRALIKERDALKEEVEKWKRMAEWFYEYVCHQGRCWTINYLDFRSKDCTCRLSEAIAEFEKLKEGK